MLKRFVGGGDLCGAVLDWTWSTRKPGDKPSGCDGAFVGHSARAANGEFKDHLDLIDGRGYMGRAGVTPKNQDSGLLACGDVMGPVYRQAVTAVVRLHGGRLDAERFLGGNQEFELMAADSQGFRNESNILSTKPVFGRMAKLMRRAVGSVFDDDYWNSAAAASKNSSTVQREKRRAVVSRFATQNMGCLFSAGQGMRNRRDSAGIFPLDFGRPG